MVYFYQIYLFFFLNKTSWEVVKLLVCASATMFEWYRCPARCGMDVKYWWGKGESYAWNEWDWGRLRGVVQGDKPECRDRKRGHDVVWCFDRGIVEGDIAYRSAKLSACVAILWRRVFAYQVFRTDNKSNNPDKSIHPQTIHHAHATVAVKVESTIRKRFVGFCFTTYIYYSIV